MNKKRNNPTAGHGSVQAIARVTNHQFQGPVPHPDTLAGYERILPGAADRIMKMAEDDAEHQRKIECLAIENVARDIKRGQYLGFSIGAASLITCLVSILLGSEKTAMVIGGSTIVGLVAVFVTGKLIDSK